jgi:hypothetical protein
MTKNSDIHFMSEEFLIDFIDTDDDDMGFGAV